MVAIFCVNLGNHETLGVSPHKRHIPRSMTPDSATRKPAGQYKVQHYRTIQGRALLKPCCQISNCIQDRSTLLSDLDFLLTWGCSFK